MRTNCRHYVCIWNSLRKNVELLGGGVFSDFYQVCNACHQKKPSEPFFDWASGNLHAERARTKQSEIIKQELKNVDAMKNVFIDIMLDIIASIMQDTN